MSNSEIFILFVAIGVPFFIILWGISIAVVIQVWRDLTGD